MRRLLIAVGVVVILLVAGDFVAKAFATTELRDRAKAAVRGATSSSASITSFPFLGRLLVAGSVQEVRVKVGPAVAGRVTFSSVAVDLNDVHVDRDRLIRDQEVRLTSVGSGTVTATLTDAEITRLAGVPISFAPNQVSVRIGGASVRSTVSMSAGTMVFGGAPVRFRVPRAPLFPCDGTKVTVKQGAVEVSCTVDRVPPELVQRVTVRG